MSVYGKEAEMELSIWNIVDELEKYKTYPMITDGTPMIKYARPLVVGRILEPDGIYVGRSSDYFFTPERQEIILVHRNDMILVENVELEDLFFEICEIIEKYNDWEKQLQKFSIEENSLSQMLDFSEYMLKAPVFIYNPEGVILGISSKYPPDIHWHWRELLENNGLTEDRMRNLKTAIQLPEVFLDMVPVTRPSSMGNHEYMHCNVTANNCILGHLVLFSFVHPFSLGLQYIVSELVKYINQHLTRYFDRYNPFPFSSQLVDKCMISDEPAEEDLKKALNELAWKEEERYQVYVIEEKTEEIPVLLFKMLSKIMQRYQSCIASIYGKHMILLLNETRDHGEVAESILVESGNGEFYCGISNAFVGFSQCHKFYNQAMQELQFCKREELEISCSDNHSMAMFKKELLEHDWIKTYVNSHVQLIYHYDQMHRTEYYRTFKALIYSNFHLSDAARILNIHRNSLTYRIERLEELIPISEYEEKIRKQDELSIWELVLSFLVVDESR